MATHQLPEAAPTTIIRLPGVMTRTGLSRSSIYSAIARNEFPRPIRLGRRAVGWDSSLVESWVRNQIEQSRDESAERRIGRCIGAPLATGAR